MMQKLRKLLLTASFEELEKELKEFSPEELDIFLSTMARDNEDICTYAFGLFLIHKNNLVECNDFVRMLLNIFFFYLDGAYFASYAHLLLATELAPNDNALLAAQLFFYDLPDKIIDAIEARQIAKKILSQDPQSELALEILDETSSIEGQPFIQLGEGLPVKEKIKLLIEKGRFPAAKKELSAISPEELNAILRVIAHDKNICAYDFLWMLLAEHETADLHSLAAEMFEQGLFNISQPIKGSVAVAAFHRRRAAELS